MSLAWSFYIATVLVYLGVDVMACWGLNLQYGYTGILNFSFIIYQAAGAYTAAVLTLGPQTAGSFQQYFGGANLPFPLPVIAGGIAGGLLSAVVGVIALRRLRSDYQAMVFLVISLIATALDATYFSPTYQDVVAFLVLIVVLLVRPQGIFAEVASQKEVAA